jgi:hypothetical protein
VSSPVRFVTLCTLDAPLALPQPCTQVGPLPLSENVTPELPRNRQWRWEGGRETTLGSARALTSLRQLFGQGLLPGSCQPAGSSLTQPGRLGPAPLGGQARHALLVPNKAEDAALNLFVGHTDLFGLKGGRTGTFASRFPRHSRGRHLRVKAISRLHVDGALWVDLGSQGALPILVAWPRKGAT